MDEAFLSAFPSMESNYATATSIPQTTWTTERVTSFHVPGAPLSFGDVGITADNTPIAPVPAGPSWTGSSLQDALGMVMRNILYYSRHPLILLPGPPCVPNTPAYAITMSPEPTPMSSCNIDTNMPCNQPLDGTLLSIRWHLALHGHKHQGKDLVQCPWAGCSDMLRWMNIPRHIRSIHLGVRMVCPTCERSFTRPLGLTKHVASNKCTVVGDIDELNGQGIADCMLK